MITEQEARERALAMLAVLGIRHGGVRRVVRVRMDAREQARLRALGVELPIQDTWSVVVGRQAGSEDLLPAERPVAVDASTGLVGLTRSL
jgi:hypothetical protein